MVSQRTERVGALILEEISCALLRLDDPRLKGVTITGAKVTKDLKIAHVSYSLIGTDERIEEAGQALTRAKGLFKRALGENLDLRYMPDLEFHYDKNPAYADRMDRLFHEIHASDPPPVKDKDDETGG